jgi:hypothetical protein
MENYCQRDLPALMQQFFHGTLNEEYFVLIIVTGVGWDALHSHNFGLRAEGVFLKPDESFIRVIETDFHASSQNCTFSGLSVKRLTGDHSIIAHATHLSISH